ncbi:MAG: fimbrillin family protein [Bacteroides sp.]|nr:fimbrillin family protein [Bacteroides sp.]
MIDGASTRAVITGDVTLNNLTFLRKDVAADAQTPSDFSSPDDTYTGGSRATGGAITLSSPAPTYDQSGKRTFLRGYTTEKLKASPTSGTTEWENIDGKTDILLTDSWNAGTYTDPRPGTSGNGDHMVFKHILSRIEVICQAEATATSKLEVVQAAWGKVTKIEVLNAYSEITYTHSTDAVEASGTTKAFELLKDYTESSTFVAIDIHENSYTTAADAVAMIPPIPLTNSPSYSFQLKVTTAGAAVAAPDSPTPIEKTINVSLGNSNSAMTAGQIHKVTLSFKADGKSISIASSTIDPWSDGSTGENNVEKPTV